MTRKFALGIIAVAWIQLSVPVASAEIYRWTDAQGGEHFSMDLNSVPPQYRAAAKASAGSVGTDANINMIPQPEGRRATRPASPARPDRATTRRSSSPRNMTEQAGEEIAGHDESWWRSRVERYASEIRAIEEQIDTCKDLKAPVRYDHRTGRRTKRQHYDDKMGAIDRCSSNQSTLDVKQRQLTNFKERARKSGVPPGWLRTR